jgi:hypothetical protein
LEGAALNTRFAQFIPLIIILVVLGLLYLVTQVLIAHNRRKNRRSPFTDNFFRSPGETLRNRLDDINVELNLSLVSAFVLPLIFYSSILTQAYFGGRPFSVLSVWILILIAAAFEVYFIYRLVLLINNRRKLRLGYEGEIAVGQELNELLRDGYYVYHDFQAEKFNIDHVVVGPTGVYAVETKARRKPTAANSDSNYKVAYDGSKLQFPDWVEIKPLDQVQRNANWLSKWLSSAIGESIQIQPVIALPGWYVDRTSSNGFPVINPKQFRSILKPSKGNKLDESLISRIKHQLDRRCRDVHPRASEGLGGKPGLVEKASI